MKTRINPLIIALFIFLLSSLAFSQNETDISKIIIGKNYKIVLFDDTEILGKIISSDSGEVKIETANKTAIIIPKGNILYYTTEMVPEKYNFMASLMGGVSFITNNFYDYGMYYNGVNPNKNRGMNINAAAIWFFSDTKAVKFDAGFTYLNAGTYQYISSYDPHNNTTYSGGNVSMFTFKANILFGRFKPEERVILYASLGFGIHSTNQDAATERYYTIVYPDTAWTQQTYYSQPVSEVNAVISVGGCAGYRFSKHFGASLEMEYDMVTGENIFLFFGNKNYFPLRAGIFYIF
jgi:hypothetical protein